MFGMVASHSLETSAMSSFRACDAQPWRHQHKLSQWPFVSSLLCHLMPVGSQFRVLPLRDHLCPPNPKWPPILIICQMLVLPDHFLPWRFIYQSAVQPYWPWSRSSVRSKALMSVCPPRAPQPGAVSSAQWVFLD